jgi:hypothetical protein
LFTTPLRMGPSPSARFASLARAKSSFSIRDNSGWEPLRKNWKLTWRAEFHGPPTTFATARTVRLFLARSPREA